MKINRIKLENFSGIKALEIDFQGRDAIISGENATGKTSIFNAYAWVLTDKNSTLEKNWSPKTKGADGKDLHNLDHAAELELETSDGETITLRKVYHETYRKKRGTNTEEFTGHTTDYFVDQVPTKKSQFEEKVVEATGVESLDDLLPLIIPHYFSEVMPWTERRATLLEISGGLDQAEVIQSNPELEPLTELLKKGKNGAYSVEELRAKTTAQRKELNKALESIPARIDEAEKAKPEVSQVKGLESKIKKAKEEIEKAEKEIREFELSQGRSKQEESAEEIRKLIRTRSEEINAANEEKTESLREKAREIRVRIEMHQQEALQADLEYRSASHSAEELTKKRNRLAEQFKKVKASKWDESEGTCSACGQPIPEENIEASRKAFNLNRAETLAKINQEGQSCTKELIDHHAQEAKEKLQEKENAQEEVDEANSELQKLKTEMPGKAKVDDDPKILELKEKLEDLLKNAPDQEIPTELVERLNLGKQNLNRLVEMQQQVALLKKQEERISELEDEEKKTSQAFLETEGILFLLDQYTKTLVKQLDQKVNEKFETVKFQLLEEQVNGGVKDTCDVLIPTDSGSDVPYGQANTGARILAGLEITQTLQEHRGIRLPIFLDNYESLSQEPPRTESQLITLAVEKKQETLKIEII